MGLKDKKRFNDKLKQWKENVTAVEVCESEYNNLLVKKYKDEINKIKEEFKKYVTEQKLDYVPKKTFVEANLGDSLKIRIEFDDPKAAKEYNFRLAIREGNRREFIIIIKPNFDVYVPSLFKPRNKPQSIEQIDLSIRNIENEYLHLQKELSKLDKVQFNICFYNNEYKPADKDSFKKYSSFTNIIEQLLS